MSRAYYNEHEPFAAAWLRELIKAGHIINGDVDERSIEDVTPADLRGYTQCHFFAGIGGWSYALRLAGWPDDRPVWTGSCPCQPFSAAGKGGGFDDERHLWPGWFHLIEQCRPGVVFGEQVDSAIRHGWLDLVQADLEGIGYAVGAVGLPAAGVGAPHIRQRLWFVSERLDNSASARRNSARAGTEGQTWDEARLRGLERGCSSGELAESNAAERWTGMAGGNDSHGNPSKRHKGDGESGERGESGELAESNQQQRDGSGDARPGGRGEPANGGVVGDSEKHGHERRPLCAHGEQADRIEKTGFWDRADWLPCRDGKARPVEPGTFPLAHGVSARVGRLRGYGNAIVPQVAAEFIEAYCELME